MKWKPSGNVSESAGTLLPRLAEKYFASGRKAAADGKKSAKELHRFRIETKRFRYTLELFRPVYGAKMDHYLQSLRELQGALGKVSDYQTIQTLLPDGDPLRASVQRSLRRKIKELRKDWQEFDSNGELKRWKTYLANGTRKGPAPRARAASSND